MIDLTTLLQAASVALLAVLVAELHALRRRLEVLEQTASRPSPTQQYTPLYALPIQKPVTPDSGKGAAASPPQALAAKTPTTKPLEAKANQREEELPPLAYSPRRPIDLEIGLGGDWRRRIGPTPLRSPEEVVEMIRRAKEKKRKQEASGDRENGKKENKS